MSKLVQTSNLLVRFAPLIFVLLWATGYVGAKYGTIDAEPFTFLAVRFGLAAIIIGVFVLVFVRPENLDRQQVVHSVLIGMLMQGVYLGGIFYAVSKGMPAGISSLIVALQPFFTAIAAFVVLGERLALPRAAFFVAALGGIVLVLFPELDFARAIPGISAETLVACLAGTIGISIGAVYQKRSVTSLNLWISTAAQFVGGFVLMALMSFALETQRLVWTWPTTLSLVWLILVLSVGAVALLMYLIRQGSSSSVASLFFLVPVVALFMTWILFGETMNTVQLFGSLIVVASVAASSKFE